MKTESCCQRVSLAQTPCCELSLCICGHFHLAVGPVTMRLEEPVLQALWHMLHEAMPRLARLREQSPSMEVPSASLRKWEN